MPSNGLPTGELLFGRQARAMIHRPWIRKMEWGPPVERPAVATQNISEASGGRMGADVSREAMYWPVIISL